MFPASGELSVLASAAKQCTTVLYYYCTVLYAEQSRSLCQICGIFGLDFFQICTTNRKCNTGDVIKGIL